MLMLSMSASPVVLYNRLCLSVAPDVELTQEGLNVCKITSVLIPPDILIIVKLVMCNLLLLITIIICNYGNFFIQTHRVSSLIKNMSTVFCGRG